MRDRWHRTSRCTKSHLTRNTDKSLSSFKIVNPDVTELNSPSLLPPSHPLVASLVPLLTGQVRPLVIFTLSFTGWAGAGAGHLQTAVNWSSQDFPARSDQCFRPQQLSGGHQWESVSLSEAAGWAQSAQTWQHCQHLMRGRGVSGWCPGPGGCHSSPSCHVDTPLCPASLGTGGEVWPQAW